MEQISIYACLMMTLHIISLRMQQTSLQQIAGHDRQMARARATAVGHHINYCDARPTLFVPTKLILKTDYYHRDLMLLELRCRRLFKALDGTRGSYRRGNRCGMRRIHDVGAVRGKAHERDHRVEMERLGVDAEESDDQGNVSPLARVAFADEVCEEEEVRKQDAKHNGKRVGEGDGGIRHVAALQACEFEEVAGCEGSEG